MNLPEPLCKLAHVIFGILTILSAELCTVLPIIFFLTFTLYELDEEWNIGDHAFEEMRVEYTLGTLVHQMMVPSGKDIRAVGGATEIGETG